MCVPKRRRNGSSLRNSPQASRTITNTRTHVTAVQVTTLGGPRTGIQVIAQRGYRKPDWTWIGFAMVIIFGSAFMDDAAHTTAFFPLAVR